MKLAFLIFYMALLFAPVVSFGAYDWEEEEVGEREIQLNRVRNYVGGADEEDLKVQKALPNPPRAADGVGLVKREDAEPDDHTANE